MSQSDLIPRLAPLPEMVEAVLSGHNTLPLKHWSPSSLAMLQRCPRQFRHRYLLGEKERPGEALVVGSAVHLGIEHNFGQKILSGEDVSIVEIQEFLEGAGWDVALSDQQERSGLDVAWDAGEEEARKRMLAMGMAYHRDVAPRVQPLEVEGWVEANFGLPLPVIGRFDVRTEHRLIDAKTGKTATYKPKPEWRMQAGCYEGMTGLGVEFHTLAASKTGKATIATPLSNPELEIRFSEAQRANVVQMIVGLAALAQHYMDTYGYEQEWPTTGWMHPWACGYCGWRSSCPAWSEA